MYSFLKNISRKTSKDVVRKLLYNTLKHSFEEVDARFDELCQCFYADFIDEKQGRNVFEELLDTLLYVGRNLQEYTSHQMEVIGLDKDCDIKFIKDKLVNYQLITQELKGGIDGRIHAVRLTSDSAKRNLIVPKYEKFTSLANETEEVLQIIYESYQKLCDVIYSDESEQVLNRFNKHFQNVKNHITEGKDSYLDMLTRLLDYGAIVKKPKERAIDKGSFGYLDIDWAQKVVYDIVNNTVGDEYYSVYDNPLELIRIIKEKELDNEQVNALFAMMVMLGLQQGVNNPVSRPRGRPPCDFCYTDCIGPIEEILSSDSFKLSRKQKKETFCWVVALFVACAEFVHEDLYGHISAFFRFLNQIGLKIRYGLRYLQMKIKEFRQYLRDKQKGGFYEPYDGEATSLWKRRLKRFAPFEKIKGIITARFTQIKLA